MIRDCNFQPDYAVAPGETLKEVLDSIGMTQKGAGCKVWYYQEDDQSDRQWAGKLNARYGK